MVGVGAGLGQIVFNWLLTALAKLTTCGKRKGAKMEGSPAVEVRGQS